MIMRVLITNDDGYTSSGLAALRDIIATDHDVWVMAPENNQSGRSHAISVETTIVIRKIADKIYSARGTPADCVSLALGGAVAGEFDVVIAGINYGANLGTDIIYSGTAGAARQASLLGTPGIALSLCSPSGRLYWEHIANFTLNHLDMLAKLGDADHFVNINCANQPHPHHFAKITTLSRRIYREPAICERIDDTTSHWVIGGGPEPRCHDDHSDVAVVERGGISVSPIETAPRQHRQTDIYEFLE